MHLNDLDFSRFFVAERIQLAGRKPLGQRGCRDERVGSSARRLKQRPSTSWQLRLHVAGRAARRAVCDDQRVNAQAGPAAEARPSAIGSWIVASRPNTLPASAAGVVAGVGAAYGAGANFRLDTAVGCMVAALLLQVFANLTNDLSDFTRGADTPDRLGPPRAVATGLITPSRMRAGMLVLAIIAGLDGLLLAYVGGPIIFIIGVATIIAAITYTGGPWPFGYKGLGELFVFLVFGPECAIGTAYLQSGQLSPLYLVASIPPGAFAVGILVTNNYRDIATDRAAGKRTLAVRFGEGFARAEYATCVAVSLLVSIGLAVAGATGLTAGENLAPGPAALFPLATVPLLVGPLRSTFSAGDPRRLNEVLKHTARTGLLFSALLGVGLAARGWPG